MDETWRQQQKDGVTLYTANKDNVFFEIYTGANRLEVIITNMSEDQKEYYNLKGPSPSCAPSPKRTIKDLLNTLPYVKNMPVELGNLLVQAERQAPIQKITEQILPPQPTSVAQPVQNPATQYYP